MKGMVAVEAKPVLRGTACMGGQWAVTVPNLIKIGKGQLVIGLEVKTSDTMLMEARPKSVLVSKDPAVSVICLTISNDSFGGMFQSITTLKS